MSHPHDEQPVHLSKSRSRHKAAEPYTCTANNGAVNTKIPRLCAFRPDRAKKRADESPVYPRSRSHLLADRHRRYHDSGHAATDCHVDLSTSPPPGPPEGIYITVPQAVKPVSGPSRIASRETRFLRNLLYHGVLQGAHDRDRSCDAFGTARPPRPFLQPTACPHVQGRPAPQRTRPPTAGRLRCRASVGGRWHLPMRGVGGFARIDLNAAFLRSDGCAILCASTVGLQIACDQSCMSRP